MKALVLLGCPEAPSQTPIGLYASYKLGQMGYDVTVSSNPAAGKILDISDPEGVYVKKRVDIEKCLDEIEEGDYDLLVGCASHWLLYSQGMQKKWLNLQIWLNPLLMQISLL